MREEHASLRRRPLFTPIWLSALAAIVVLAFATWLWSTASATTVIVIRHAETTAGETDPSLSEAGRARAERLATLFGDAARAGHLDALYVSRWRRTQQTAAPLAARLGLTPVVVDDADPRGLARRMLRANAGRRVLLVWHADDIPRIVEALSGVKSLPPLAADEYGAIYVVTVPGLGHATLLSATY